MIFFNFIIKRVNIHGVAPSPIFWEHVKERKITKFGVIGTVRPPPPIRIFIIFGKFLFFCFIFLQVPIFVSLVVLVTCVYLVVAPFLDGVKMEYVFAFSVLVVGAFIYFPFIYFRFSVPGSGKLKMLKIFLVILRVSFFLYITNP